MSFDFLTPTPTAERPARGPLLDAAAEAGAVCEVRDGWELITSFGAPEAEAAACLDTVGFADLSHLSKLELQSTGSPTLAESLGAKVGRTARRIGGGWLCVQAPSVALAIGAEPGAVGALGVPARNTDLTASLGALALAGPAARDVFARFCALDVREGALPVGDFRPVSVARTPGFVLREADECFLMLFGAAFGQYIWEVVADAVDHLGGRPVGIDALSVDEEPARA